MLAEGLTEGWEGVGKVTEGEKYQGRGQENGVGGRGLALSEPATPTETN